MIIQEAISCEANSLCNLIVIYGMNDSKMHSDKCTQLSMLNGTVFMDLRMVIICSSQSDIHHP